MLQLLIFLIVAIILIAIITLTSYKFLELLDDVFDINFKEYIMSHIGKKCSNCIYSVKPDGCKEPHCVHRARGDKKYNCYTGIWEYEAEKPEWSFNTTCHMVFGTGDCHYKKKKDK